MESASRQRVGHADDTTSTTGRPRPTSRSRLEAQFLGMLLFIISEIMLFGAFFTAYFFIRVVADADPGRPSGERAAGRRSRASTRRS